MTTNIATANHGNLCNYSTGEIIRAATRDELITSIASGETGTFKLDGITVYVDRTHDELEVTALAA